MTKKYVGLLVATLAVSVTAACGSSGSSGDGHHAASGSASPSQASRSAAPSRVASASGDSDVSAFCAHIAPGSSGPADAFGAIELWDASTARQTALAEAKLMNGVVPPAAIAKDWNAWRSFVQAVIQATAKNADASLASLGRQDQKVGGAEKRLTDYAFAQCG